MIPASDDIQDAITDAAIAFYALGDLAVDFGYLSDYEGLSDNKLRALRRHHASAEAMAAKVRQFWDDLEDLGENVAREEEEGK
ncbi:hypothetical protein QP405_05715 [Gleimia europaea]|uniref:hypothetical protein n=1 Tax=Gleimia europaea TaxID=66228 RepID=UPI00265B4817|nr:hypothetical protein [Gleimia europaea]MDK7143355.1 hypothetical protein [Gleimia europaea]